MTHRSFTKTIRAIVSLTLALIFALCLFTGCRKDAKKEAPQGTEAAPEMPYSVPGFAMLNGISGITFDNGLQVLCAGTYSGYYLEDGSDEQIENVLCIVVKNNGTSLVEYGQIELPLGKNTANFEFSGLPVGAAVLVQEKNRMTADSDTKTGNSFVCISAALPAALVFDFGNDFELYPDDGVLNIKNISDRDFTSDVSVFYKNFENGLFMGGITYRARFSGGIKAGEYAQSMQMHFWNDTSAILYMSYAD